MDGLVVMPAGALSEDQLGQVRAIYEDAFIPGLRVPFAELTATGNADQMFVAADGPVPVAFASLRLLMSAGWSFLRYFAVASPRRSQGIGRRFWQLLQTSVTAAGWPARIVLEVEVPAEAADDEPERLLRQRRIAFWTACGAQLVAAPGYVLPDFTGRGMTEPMSLMASTPGPAPATTADELMSLLLAIYTDRYRLSHDHPIVIEALASLTSPARGPHGVADPARRRDGIPHPGAKAQPGSSS